MASKSRTITIDLDKLNLVFMVLTILLALAVGLLWRRVSVLEKTGVAAVPSDVRSAAAPLVGGKLSEEQIAKLPPVDDDDYIRGNRDAKVSIVEYSDLECPFCQKFHATAQQAVDEYDGQVNWVYRHFPLDTIHPKARPSALAAECVGEIGGNDSFWAFVDLMFLDQQANLSDLEGSAGKIGIDIGKFASCVDDGKLMAQVDEDYEGGIDVGVSGTPANFIVNSQGEVWLMAGAVPYETLKATLDEALGL